MCIPKQQKIANIVPAATDAPDQAPDPVNIPTPDPKKTVKKNPLRIDLAASTIGKSGVNL